MKRSASAGPLRTIHIRHSGISVFLLLRAGPAVKRAPDPLSPRSRNNARVSNAARCSSLALIAPAKQREEGNHGIHQLANG
jgi:hypothetical protein